MTEDEMVGWHHRLNRHGYEQTPGVGDGQGSPACRGPWGRRVREAWRLEDGRHRQGVRLPPAAGWSGGLGGARRPRAPVLPGPAPAPAAWPPGWLRVCHEEALIAKPHTTLIGFAERLLRLRPPADVPVHGSHALCRRIQVAAGSPRDQRESSANEAKVEGLVPDPRLQRAICPHGCRSLDLRRRACRGRSWDPFWEKQLPESRPDAPPGV